MQRDRKESGEPKAKKTKKSSAKKSSSKKDSKSSSIKRAVSPDPAKKIVSPVLRSPNDRGYFQPDVVII